MKKNSRTIEIGSVSAASSVKRQLAEKNIYARLVKTGVGRDGCLWGIRVKEDDLPTTLSLLRFAGLAYVIR